MDIKTIHCPVKDYTQGDRIINEYGYSQCKDVKRREGLMQLQTNQLNKKY